MFYYDGCKSAKCFAPFQTIAELKVMAVLQLSLPQDDLSTIRLRLEDSGFGALPPCEHSYNVGIWIDCALLGNIDMNN